MNRSLVRALVDSWASVRVLALPPENDNTGGLAATKLRWLVITGGSIARAILLSVWSGVAVRIEKS